MAESDSTTTRKAGLAFKEALNPLVWKAWNDYEGAFFNGLKLTAMYFIYRMVRGK